MQLHSTILATASAAPAALIDPPPIGPELPAISLRSELKQLPEGRPQAGWSTPDDRPRMVGGTLVSVQRPVLESIGVVQRWFGSFYGASTHTQMILGDVVRNLGSAADESQAMRAALELTRGPGAPSVALLKQGADWVVRATLAPNIRSPYATGMHSDKEHGRKIEWAPFRAKLAYPNIGPDTGSADGIRFLSSAVRAVIDGATIFRNHSRYAPDRS